MVDLDQGFPGYASYITLDARAKRDAMPPELRLKVMEISELLALNPKDFENRTQKLPVGKDVYLYEHPDPSFQITYQLVDDAKPRVIKFVHFAALKMEVKRTLFISYSHEDENWLKELRECLKGLEDQDVALWDDRQIEAGARWKDEIEKALTDAKAALLLVSPHFLNSQFITKKELPSLLKKAEKEGLRIFWIPVSASRVQDTPIAEFQAAVEDVAIPMDKLRKAKRKAQYDIVYAKISGALGLR